jgi:hypothetical protein
MSTMQERTCKSSLSRCVLRKVASSEAHLSCAERVGGQGLREAAVREVEATRKEKEKR